MVALARVTADLAEARGPDVACSIEVPVAWFEAGATLQIQLPRLMQCARCEGGGCDACGRRGAFEQQAAGFATEVAVVLPKQAAASCAPVKLRLPALGARAPQPLVVRAEVGLVVASEQPLAGEGAGLAAEAERSGAEAERNAAEAERSAAEAGAVDGAEAASEAAASAGTGPQPALPPGHLLLTVIPRPPDPAWVPPGNVKALVLVPPQRSFWAWLRPLELLLFPDRLAAALGVWWQTRAPAALQGRPAWIWAALAVVVTVLLVWLLTRSGSRSQ